ncbi:phosphotransferase family protein [Plantactinospora sonchi]|uniref:Aminoglycoside phosphotransferase family protein n=1 Tax=Plantactinospora sonchi TaxID=1544735 RepID=A0ABU7S3Y3_9ACTN
MDEIRDLVAAHLPGYVPRTVVLLGEGADNVAYEVNDELVVRLVRRAEDAAEVAREARLLTAVAGVSPLPVPVPAFAVPELGCLAYVKLRGRPLLELSPSWRSAHRESVGAMVGELLAALHTTGTERLAAVAVPDDSPPEEWLAEAGDHYEAVSARVPEIHRAAIEAFVATAPPSGGYPLVFSHNDLGIEHLLVDPVHGTVTGVIDWGDAAFVDPAYDFGLLYRDLGPVALDAALCRYHADDAALRQRAVFYARCSVIEDLAYGLETDDLRYVDKSLAALDWLFR